MTGAQLLAEYSGCDAAILDDAAAVEALLVKAAAAAGATVVAPTAHGVGRRGRTSVIVLEASHLSVQTWPEAEHASVGLFTSSESDLRAAHPVLFEGLRAQSSEIVELERGLPGAPKMRVLAHHPLESITLDCSDAKLPHTIRLDHSPRRGLGLFATRAFDPDELIYETPMRLVSNDTEYTLQTDIGDVVLVAEDLGRELTVAGVLRFPESMFVVVANHYGLDAPSPIMLRERVTGSRTREVLATTFHALINCARDANVELQWPPTTLTFDGSEPVWSARVIATQPIASGDELFSEWGKETQSNPVNDAQSVREGERATSRVESREPGGRVDTTGTHIVVEYSGCDRGILDDEAALQSLLLEAAGAAGAAVVDPAFRRFGPTGVTFGVVAEGSHVTIHSRPEAGCASADIYTSGALDPHRGHAVLGKELGAQASQVISVSRGLTGPEKMRVRDHRRVESITLDCRAPQLPDTVRVGRSPGRGFGFFATRDFAAGDIIYEAPVRLANWRAEFILETDLGRSVHTSESLGYELYTEVIEMWPEHVHRAIALHYDLQDPEPEEILEAITGNFERETMITSFDGLINHASDPNAALDWPTVTIYFDEDDLPAWTVALRAKRSIRAGEELFVNYRCTLFDYVPPREWLP